jgi:translocation and assembly module TamB
LDVLSVSAGEQGGLTGTKLEAGRYFGDKVYIGYTGRYGADPYRGENSNAVRFEYQFTPRWEFDAEYGDARAGSADIVWAKEY